MVQRNRQQAIEKLQGIIAEGRGRTMTAVQEIQAEFEQRRDLIVRPQGLDFEIDEAGVHPVIVTRGIRAEGYQDRGERDRYDLTGHSYAQVLERTGIPKSYADDLIKRNERDLLLRNLTERIQVVSPEGVLVRHVGPKIKGFLSTAFKTMDAAPIFEGFAKEAVARGFVPYRGLNTDMRMALTFLYPQVFEPKAGEFVVYGVQAMTGDYGGIANQLAIMALRIWCDNLGVGFDLYRKIHIGRRFEGNGDQVIALSKKTLALDTAAVVSATQDAVRSSMNYFAPLNEAITAAADHKPDVAATLKALGKKGIKKSVLEQAEKLFESEMPVEALPQEKSTWRLSNVLSLLAKSAQGDDKVDLEEAAFDLIGFQKKVA